MGKERITSIKLIPDEEFELIKTQILEIKYLVQQLRVDNVASQRYTKSEARQILKVCPKTMDNYLNKGVLPFSQYKSKIYIKAADIEAFFQRYYVKK